MTIRYVSIFSGIEAASAAWGPLGFVPVAFAEIDDFPSAVLRKRYPDVPNLGDVSNVDWLKFKEEHGAIDLVVGGPPCQSWSVAGNRGGLSDPRGKLVFEYVRCIRELMPQWIVLENVPGLLTADRGRPYAQLLSKMDELGYGLAWRILDAQFFGVAQRRQRLFLVGHLGDMRACEVLFEPESLRWDTPSVREQREALARATGRGSQADSLAFKSRTGADTYIKADGKVGTAGNGALVSEELAFTLATTCDQSIAMSSGQANAEITTDGLSPTLTCLHEQPIVLDRASFNQGENAQYPPPRGKDRADGHPRG